MLDKTSKKFLKYLSQQPDYSVEYYDDAFPPQWIDEESAYALIRHLNQSGYVEIIKTTSDISMGVRLSHQGLHHKEFSIHRFLCYAADKWIDLLALLVATVALILSILK